MSRRGFSFVKVTITLLVLIALTSIGLYTAFSWVPRDLQNVEGIESASSEEVVDLSERLKAAVDQSYKVTITESELNRYVNAKLQLTQSPIVKNIITIEGVAIDLKPDVIDVTIKRTFDYPENIQEGGTKKFSFLPWTQTVSMQLHVVSEQEKDGGMKTTVSFPGGQFGKSPAPGQLIQVVKPSFDTIAEFFEKEIDLGYRQMTSVKVEEGIITLDASLLPTPNVNF